MWVSLDIRPIMKQPPKTKRQYAEKDAVMKHIVSTYHQYENRVLAYLDLLAELWYYVDIEVTSYDMILILMLNILCLNSYYNMCFTLFIILIILLSLDVFLYLDWNADHPSFFEETYSVNLDCKFDQSIGNVSYSFLPSIELNLKLYDSFHFAFYYNIYFQLPFWFSDLTSVVRVSVLNYQRKNNLFWEHKFEIGTYSLIQKFNFIMETILLF